MMHQGEFRTGGYLEVIKRRKWIIVQAVVVVPLVAVLLSLGQGKLYKATAEVLLTYQNLAAGVTGTADNSGVLQQPDRLAQTQVVVARVPAIFDRAVARAGVAGRTAQELRDASNVSVASDADILDFQVTDPNRSAATRLATAYARGYTIYKKGIDSASIVRARNEVQNRIRELRRDGRAGSPLYNDLVSRDQQLATLESLSTSNAFVIRPASSAIQVRPKPLRNALLGVLAGLLLGLGLAFVWERFDTRVRSVEELEDMLGLPLLARLPEPGRQIVAANWLATLDEPMGALAESFRVLGTRIELANVDAGKRILLVTSAMHGEGKSPVASNLAVTLARAGRRVVLVDLDLRRPAVGGLFDIDSRVPGITDVALGRAELDDSLVPITLSDTAGASHTAYASNGRHRSRGAGVLEVLVAGALPPDPGDFVGTETLIDILREVAERADFVIIDGPPIVGRIHDAMVLSSHAHAVVAVARLGVVSRPMARELWRVLETSPAETLGFVVIGAEVSGETREFAAYYDGPPTKPERRKPDRRRTLRDRV
jgi:succinoglycan biosynthesis transport protein ExoP